MSFPFKSADQYLKERSGNTASSSDPASNTEVPRTPGIFVSAEEYRKQRNASISSSLTPAVTPPPVEGTWGTVVSTVTPVLEFLSRGQYASAKFVDSFANESKGILESFLNAGEELVAPKDKLSYSDVIRRGAPVWAKDNPKTTVVLGFLGDVAFDPFSYLGVGMAKSGIKIGGKALTEAGEVAFKGLLAGAKEKTTLQAALEAGKVTGTVIPKKTGTIYKEVLGETRTAIEQVGTGRVSAEEKVLRALKENLKGVVSPTLTTKQAEQITLENIHKFAGLSKERSDEVVADMLEMGVLSIFGKGKGLKAGQAKMLRLNFEDTIPDILVKMDIEPSKYLKVESGLKNVIGNEVTDFSLTDFGKFGKVDASGAFRKLNPVEQYANAEQLIQRTASVDSALFDKAGLRLLFAGKEVPGSAKVLNFVGLNYLKDTIVNSAVSKLSGLKPVQVIAGIFSKNYGLPEEFVKLKTGIENTFDFDADDIIRETKKLISYSDDRKELIGRTMANIDDATRELEFEAVAALPKGQAFKAITPAHYQEIITDNLAKAKLTPAEHATTAILFQRYKEMGELEMRAGLLKQMNQNYNPRYYKTLGNPQEINSLFQGKQGLSTTLRAGKQRDFLTLAEAEAKGYVPELDAAMIYASRMLDSRKKLSIKQFKDSVDELYGSKNLVGGNIPPSVMNDLKTLGEAKYPQGMDDNFKAILQGYDKYLGWWKRVATGVKPSFAPKQVVSNAIQSAMVIGIRAFKVFDPRSAVDAALLLNGKQATYGKLPPFIDNLFSKHFSGQGSDAILASRLATTKIAAETRLQDYAAQYAMTTAFGQKISGTELVDEMRKNGIIKGLDVSGEVFGNRMKRELSSSVDFGRLGNVTGLNNKISKESAVGVAAQLGKWWDHAAMAEDYGRAMLYINGRRLGHSPEAAQQLTNKALFDYGRGLSNVEKNIIRRVIPFYTFQRFALPLVFRSLATKPGVALTTDKTFKLFEKLLVSGDSLAPSEQEIFGDSFLVTQPRVFRGFDKEGKATFNILNSLTPLDTINLLEYNKDGSLNIQRSAEKGILATITPFIKVPLETLLDKNFFTGKTLENAGKLGNLSKTPGYGTAEALYNYLPDSVKDFIGWETRTNAISGKTSTFVNPYLAYWMQSAVPGIKTFIKPLNAGQSPLDASMDLILGIPTVKMDLKEQQGFLDLGRKKELQEIKTRFRGATIKGSKSEADNAMDDYKRLIETIKQSGALRQQGQVRGGVAAEETEQASPIAAPER